MSGTEEEIRQRSFDNASVIKNALIDNGVNIKEGLAAGGVFIIYSLVELYHHDPEAAEELRDVLVKMITEFELNGEEEKENA